MNIKFASSVQCPSQIELSVVVGQKSYLAIGFHDRKSNHVDVDDDEDDDDEDQIGLKKFLLSLSSIKFVLSPGKLSATGKRR